MVAPLHMWGCAAHAMGAFPYGADFSVGKEKPRPQITLPVDCLSWRSQNANRAKTACQWTWGPVALRELVFTCFCFLTLSLNSPNTASHSPSSTRVCIVRPRQEPVNNLQFHGLGVGGYVGHLNGMWFLPWRHTQETSISTYSLIKSYFPSPGVHQCHCCLPVLVNKVQELHTLREP